MRDALDLEFYAGLEYRTYEYINVLPRQYIVHLETNFCPLDTQTISNLKAHYNRGAEPNKQLPKFDNGLDQEKDNLAVDGVIVSNDDKFNHDLTNISFFEGKLRSMKTVHRLTAKVQRREPRLLNLRRRHGAERIGK